MSKRVELTKSQAQAFSEIYQRKEAAVREWTTALTLAGIDPERFDGGDLTADPPYFTMKDDAS